MKKKRRPPPRPLTPSEMGKRSRAKLTKKQRSDAARVAAVARWARVRDLVKAAQSIVRAGVSP